MKVVEKAMVILWAVWTVIWTPIFIVSLESGDSFVYSPAFNNITVANILLGWICIILVLRDVYLRDFKKPNRKIIRAVLILMTGGIGFIVYLFKYAFKERGPITDRST